MRRLRAFIMTAMATLALPGFIQTVPVARAQSQGNAGAIAYGPPPSYAAPRTSHSGGAIAALRKALSTSRRPSLPASTSEAYAAGPAPSRIKSAVVSSFDASYRLDTGDRLRIVVYGQDGLTNVYAIDASGVIALPLIGAVTARGRTAAALATEIAGRLRDGFIREPSVAVQIDAYRPFFILGEVAAPGQYPYVPNMTVESAVAIAGGFAPRAKRDAVGLTHVTVDGALRTVVPIGTLIDPGDTVQVGERWF
jgi:polysaccharide export outer membrane protein